MRFPMAAPRVAATIAAVVLASCPAAGQFREASSKGPRLVNTAVHTWRFGVVVTAGSGALRNVVATTTVPTDWPEQRVRIVAEEVTPGARITYRMVDEAAREMALRAAALAPGSQLRGVVTVEVTRSWQAPPQRTDIYVAPDPRRLDPKLRVFLAPSPYIESNDPQIRTLARRIASGSDPAWDRVEAIYDWVRENVQFVDNRGQTPKSTLATLKQRTGDCDELTSLFIALCRAAGIPARTVRVPGHCYPEFYLLDDEGQGHWFPCQAGGTRAFGGMPEHRPILQKGDNLLVYDPQRRRRRQYRFLPSNLSFVPVGAGGSPPRLEIICEPVAE